MTIVIATAVTLIGLRGVAFAMKSDSERMMDAVISVFCIIVVVLMFTGHIN